VWLASRAATAATCYSSESGADGCHFEEGSVDSSEEDDDDDTNLWRALPVAHGGPPGAMAPLRGSNSPAQPPPPVSEMLQPVGACLAQRAGVLRRALQAQLGPECLTAAHALMCAALDESLSDAGDADDDEDGDRWRAFPDVAACMRSCVAESAIAPTVAALLSLLELEAELDTTGGTAACVRAFVF